MKERIFSTVCGDIHYWQDLEKADRARTLLFLPGLLDDHRLFEKQISFFRERFNVFTWDAPGHAASWPFRLDFSLSDEADWLHAIVEAEHIRQPVIIGHSMGGYVGQAYMERFPGELSGFVAMDSDPLQRSYVQAPEIWLYRLTAWLYPLCPWPLRLRTGPAGCAESVYGRQMMLDFLMTYDGDPQRYAAIGAHGFTMLADALEADLPYRIDCPALLICGDRDRSLFTRAHNETWHRQSGIDLAWVRGAGHNAGTDDPRTVNQLIDRFLRDLESR